MSIREPRVVSESRVAINAKHEELDQDECDQELSCHSEGHRSGQEDIWSQHCYVEGQVDAV